MDSTAGAVSTLTAVQALEAKTIPNPFVDEINYKVFYNYFKVVFLAPLALLRIILVLLVTFIGYWITIILSEKQLQRCFSIIPRTLMSIFGFYYVPVKNIGYLETAKRENAIAVYNHVSFFDGALLSGCVHPFAFAINSGHGSVFILSRVVVKLHYILIDFTRGAGQTAKIQEHVNSGRNMLIIAPEGTTTNGKALLKFRSGAFVPMRPIQPIILRYPHRHLNPAWTYLTDARVILWRSLTQLVLRAEIELLPLVHPVPDETPADFAARVRQIMAAALAIPTVDLSRDDGLEYLRIVTERRREFGVAQPQAPDGAAAATADGDEDVESCWPCRRCRGKNRVASNYAQ